MNQDPTLLTTFECVLSAMAGLVAWVLFVTIHRVAPDLPCSAREENRFRYTVRTAEAQRKRI